MAAIERYSHKPGIATTHLMTHLMRIAFRRRCRQCAPGRFRESRPSLRRRAVRLEIGNVLRTRGGRAGSYWSLECEPDSGEPYGRLRCVGSPSILLIDVCGCICCWRVPTSGSRSARRRHVVGPVRASTPGEYRQASLLSWTRKLASRSDELGLLRGLGHRHDADLLHQCELVPERPGLDDLAILELAGDDTGDVGLLAGGGDVGERAGVRATGAQVLHDVVALGDLALDDDLGVRERCRVDLHGLPRALRTATEVRL